MSHPRLILVGGFLGAGKTTLLAQAALRLSQQGKRVGLVANDQAAELVDTEVFRLGGACVEEVAGGCFCCRFPDMVAAFERLAGRAGADVLLGEPVGSCTDLAATVMHPLKDLHARQFDLAPLSVLVDGDQMRAPQRFPENVRYIYEKQLEEADSIVLNKTDRLTGGERAELESLFASRFPGKRIMAISALSGEGVDAWLDYAMGSATAVPHVVDVDYDTYADGEAALGWFNESVVLYADGATDWRDYASRLLGEIRSATRARSAEIAHVKLIIRQGEESVAGNVTGNDGPLSVLGSWASAGEATMQLNARVHIGPDELRTICDRAQQTAAEHSRLRWRTAAMRSLSPGRPVPTHRYKP